MCGYADVQMKNVPMGEYRKGHDSKLKISAHPHIKKSVH